MRTSDYKAPDLYASPESTRVAFELAVKHQAKLMRVLKRVARSWGGDTRDKAQVIAEELWGEVVLERGPRIIELWDPARTANVENYFVRSVRQYAEKRLRRRHNRDPKQAPDFDRGSKASVERAEVKAEAELILSQLQEFDAWVLRAHLIMGYSYAEIAEALGKSKSFARVSVRRALRAARELAGSDSQFAGPSDGDEDSEEVDDDCTDRVGVA